MRHAHGHRLVRDHHGARRALALGLAPREGVDQRREVGPGVGEEEVHAPVLEQFQVRLRDVVYLQRLHAGLPQSRWAARTSS